MKLLEKITSLLNSLFVIIAAVFLVLMCVLTCASIISRFLGMPIRGTVEIVSFFAAITATFALAYTQIKKDHICVTILVDKFPVGIKKTAGVINDLMCMTFSLIAAIQIFNIGTSILRSGEVTETLRIIFYPFVYAAAAGFGLLTIVFIVELLKMAVDGLIKEPTPFEKEFEAQDN